MILKISKLSKTYRNIGRLRTILSIIIKNGFEDVINRLHLPKFLQIGREQQVIEKQKFTTWELLHITFEELGPAFVKFGQLLSSRPDIIPKDLITELEKLQCDVKPFDFDDARKIVEKELQNDVSSLFESFEKEPFASASMAQVHTAILKTGEKVAIKIQRPGIRKTIETDLEIMLYLAGLVEKYIPELRSLEPVRVVEEFEKAILKELDFKLERTHIERFRLNFKGEKNIYVPKVYKQFSTKKVLVMEFVDGMKITETKKLVNQQLEPDEIAENGAQLILKQVFIHGFFHSDPHPGNIIIKQNGQICFIDFGQMGTLLPRHRAAISDLLIGYINRDARKMTNTLVAISINKDEIDEDSLEVRLNDLLEQYSYLPINEIDAEGVTNQIIDLLVMFRIHMPSSFYLLVKSLLAIDGVARQLSPDFEIVEQVKPFVKSIIRSRMNPVKILHENYFLFIEVLSLVKDLPFELQDLLRKAKSGKLQLNVHNQEVSSINAEIKNSANKFSLAIIVAALYISSSVCLYAEVKPFIFELSFIGVAGYTMATFLAIVLFLTSVLRK